jgi:uncharacterized damage-inducible protein DinB
MKNHLKQLVEHMRWAHTRTLESLKQIPLEEGVRLLAHVLTTEQIYHQRICGKDPWPQDFWPALSIKQCAMLITQNYEHYRHFLQDHTEEDLNSRVRYRNSKGHIYHTIISEMFLHLTLHGEHHRGQIARVIRAAGGEPAETDYITYTRERDKKSA